MRFERGYPREELTPEAGAKKRQPSGQFDVGAKGRYARTRLSVEVSGFSFATECGLSEATECGLSEGNPGKSSRPRRVQRRGNHRVSLMWDQKKDTPGHVYL